MSSSIAIPKRKQAAVVAESSSSPNSYGSSTMGLPMNKGKQRASDGVPSSCSPISREWVSPRRPSLLGNSLSKSEYTVINLAHSEAPPRLVTCVKSSQGFNWNQELFLPSYADYDSHDLEHRPDPVEDIILTDEEAAAMLPQ
ncbi:hypothetical protein DOTSEDRAFT_73133 [Dothistroma septosporum NZE10]|uniref:Uncharacterized protein n=1 Tax=Dothistroma septosporum (strain NZE10 / CBS 128990) TaxID=675120 RepID=N1PJD4_DOTSN|nr:hypothetical protein DOTSEDRAFT_73133 [Dothistroma septosporum NZE10]